ncbi:M56 family metallopeptidase, partial [Cupriavidus sp. SIMBA_020]|uniref:M56 family metallopeptidase n=1 Tax=Cupriavidus sp. SIMBA_020 TaxID=3085766 RepID=UPI003977FF6D
KRADYLVNLLQSVIEALLFFHPAVWWLSHRIRIERECVADQIAGTLIQNPRRLALALEELDALQSSSAGYARVAQSARGGQLLDRIKRLCHPVPPSPHWVACVPAITVCFVALCVTAQTLWQVPVTQPAAGIVPAGLLASSHVVVIDDKSGHVL